MLIEKWFPTFIAQDALPNVSLINEQLAVLAYKIKESDSTVTQWRCNTYSSIKVDIKEHKSDCMEYLLSQIVERVFSFAEKVEPITSNTKIECTGVWFNIAERTQYQEIHSHIGDHFSVVYYVQAGKDCGDIVFHDTKSFLCGNSFAKELPTCAYKAREGNLLVFKSETLHQVMPNDSEKDRISVALNFKLVG
tara:strand:+ start:79 stop:657 length:579 start_codon:yes stop_codon:yes gene_type:complete